MLFTVYIGSAIATAPAPTLDELPIEELIAHFATQYHVDYISMYRTIECETRFRNVQSEIVKNGVREESYGYSQIHLPSHPNITKEQSLTPSFAIEFMAKEFSKGRQWQWTCARKLGFSK